MSARSYVDSSDYSAPAKTTVDAQTIPPFTLTSPSRKFWLADIQAVDLTLLDSPYNPFGKGFG
jgi:hypothetical protein